MRFLLRNGAVLDAARHHEHLTWPEGYVPITKPDRDTPVQHHEEVIGVGVAVPHELPFHLDYQKIVSVELADHAWLPVSVEGRELLCEIDGVHAGIHKTRKDDIGVAARVDRSDSDAQEPLLPQS